MNNNSKIYEIRSLQIISYIIFKHSYLIRKNKRAIHKTIVITKLKKHNQIKFIVLQNYTHLNRDSKCMTKSSKQLTIKAS